MKKTNFIMLAMLAVLTVSVLLLSVSIVRLKNRETSVTVISPGSSRPTQTIVQLMPESENPDLLGEYIARMTPEEKVWQMIYVFPEYLGLEKTCSDPELWAQALEKYPAGGIVVNSENMESMEQLTQMLSAIKQTSRITPFLGVDEEGGDVARVAFALNETTSFHPMYAYRDEGEAVAFSNAATIAGELREIGFNQDFAPVADVWTNPDNKIIGTRAYSDDPAQAARLVAAAVNGFRSAGMISTLKHFPGHGDTLEDSHFASAHSAKTLLQLNQCEFLPFVSGIQANAGMVMVGHIVMDNICPDIPATLSPAIVTGLLREDLGWNGVVITDSFAMAALTDAYSEAEAAVLAIGAGCDIILGPTDPQAVAQALLHSVSSERIDESVRRILELKLQYGLFSLS